MSAAKNKLTEEEIQERILEYGRTKAPAVRDEIVLQYTNLVESVARRFAGACESLEDLTQEGYIGLITAVDLYDATKGVKFSTYATHFIIGQIKHYLRDKGKIIKEPAWLQELNQKMSRVIESLSQKMGRQPTETEIGQVMGIPEETVAELLTTREVFKVSSLDGGSDKDDNNNNPVDPEKIKGQKLVSFQLPMEDKIVLETALDRLKTLEQKVIYEFFYLDLNQTEIAKKLGISCNYVSHILRNSTKKLKKILMTDEIRDAQMQIGLMAKRLQDATSSIEQMTVIDSVTGLYNRRYLMERLDEEVCRACRYSYEVALVLVQVQFPEDLSDYVRMIRRDDILHKAGEKIKASIRKVDVACRLSDSVFAVILPHTGQQAQIVVERLRNCISSIAIELAGKKIALEAVVGCAVYGEDGSSAAELVVSAANSGGIPEADTLEDVDDMRRAA